MSPHRIQQSIQIVEVDFMKISLFGSINKRIVKDLKKVIESKIKNQKNIVVAMVQKKILIWYKYW